MCEKMVTFEDSCRQLTALLRFDKPFKDILRASISVIRQLDEFECIAIRLKSEDDYPYYYSSGFTSSFLEREQYICCKTGSGEIESRCLCLNVLEQKISYDSGLVTEAGSFWSNSTTLLKNSLTDDDCWLLGRGYCLEKGYESIALIPIANPDEPPIGLIQINDSRVEILTPALLDFLENYASLLALFLELKEEAQVNLNNRLFILSKELFIEKSKNIDLIMRNSSQSLESRELLTICCQCKKVRSEIGEWIPVEKFIRDKSNYSCSHAFCTDCYEKWLEEMG